MLREAAGHRSTGRRRPSPTTGSQLLRYLVVGGGAFVLDFGLLALLRSGPGWPAWLAATIAFAVSTVFSFWMQKTFTFGSTIPAGGAAVRYGVLLAANMVFTAAVVELFDQYGGLYLVGKVVTTTATTLWNFPLMRRWVYRAPLAADRP